MKKVGRILLCFLPLIVCIVLQLAGALFGSMAAGVVVGVQMGMEGVTYDTAYMNQRINEVYMEGYPVLLCMIQFFAVVTGCIWVYFLFGKKKPGNPVKAFSGVTLVVVILCALGLQYGCSYALEIIEGINPALMENYKEMVEMAGLMDMNPVIILATVCLAPLGEELLFRGVTLRLAKNAGCKFMVANIIQALCFGIAHLNVVQGIYAFFTGIIIGYVYEKYNSLYVPILLHAIVNLLGTVAGAVLERIFGESTAEPALAIYIILCVIFMGILTAGVALIGKDKKVLKPVTDKGEDVYAAI